MAAKELLDRVHGRQSQALSETEGVIIEARLASFDVARLSRETRADLRAAPDN